MDSIFFIWSLIWSSSTEGKSSLPQTFPLVWDWWIISSTDWGEGIQYISLLHILLHQVSCPFHRWTWIFPQTYTLMYLSKPVLLSFMSLVRFNSSWAFAFLTSSLHIWRVFLYFSWVTCPWFYVLQASFHICVLLGTPCSCIQLCLLGCKSE